MGIYMLEKQHERLLRQLKHRCEMRRDEMIGQIVEFIRERFRKSGQKIAVIGASGGVDSSLTAWLAVMALGAENVLLVKLPYEGLTSDESSAYVDLLAKALGMPKRNVVEVSIKKSTDASIEELKDQGFILESVDEGNMMARQRMNKLFAIARLRRGMVLDTCNFTEILLGYLTKFGDGASDLNPIGTLYKTWVLMLAEYLGVPNVIVMRKPTAELRVGQTDEDDLEMRYAVADVILWLHFGLKVPFAQIVTDYGFPAPVVEMLEERIEKNEHKRVPTPLCVIEY